MSKNRSYQELVLSFLCLVIMQIFVFATLAATESEEARTFDQALKNAWSSNNIALWKEIVSTNVCQRSDWKPAIIAQYGVLLYDADYTNAASQLLIMDAYVNSKRENSIFKQFYLLYNVNTLNVKMAAGDLSALPVSMRQAYLDLEAQKGTRQQRLQEYNAEIKNGVDYPGRALIVEYIHICQQEEAAQTQAE